MAQQQSEEMAVELIKMARNVAELAGTIELHNFRLDGHDDEFEELRRKVKQMVDTAVKSRQARDYWVASLLKGLLIAAGGALLAGFMHHLTGWY